MRRLAGLFFLIASIGCLIALCVSLLNPSIKAATRFSLLYNLPLFSAFFFWLRCRMRETAGFSALGIILDVFAVCVAGSRFYRAVLPPSGHALFLSYSLLTVRNRFYRAFAVILLIATAALKLSWGDYGSLVYGIAGGLLCGFAYCKLTNKSPLPSH